MPLCPPILRTSTATGSSEEPAPRALGAGGDEVGCGSSGGESTRGVQLESKQTKAVKNWPEPKPERDIQVFIGFANFHRRFIRGFSRIAAPLTAILKTTGSSEESAPKAFRADGDEVVRGGRANETVKNLSKFRKSNHIAKFTSTPIQALIR